MILQKVVFLFITLFFINACATFKRQYDSTGSQNTYPNKEIAHSFYLIGDAGIAGNSKSSQAVKAFESELLKASENSTVVFLGDNIYPKGLPRKGDKGRKLAESQLNAQIGAVKNFKGKTIFIPGNHDWYSNGLKGLKRQEKYIEDALGKNTFLPENGCPIEKVKISDSIVMIVIDTEWYLTNWDKHPTINDDCEIKSRFAFFEELEDLIKKARGKTTIIAMHHPMFTNGPHGGQYSFNSHLKPIPVLGTLKNILRKTSGVSPADLQNKKYNAFKKRIVTLAQENDKTLFVSGHEHSLQYLIKDNIPQIVSGSGSKTSATLNIKDAFSASEKGFARLDVFIDGSSVVRFYSADKDEMIFQTQVFSEDNKKDSLNYITFPARKTASIYTKEEVEKSGFHKYVWGQRYRSYYGTQVNVPTVNLDTLFGGLKVFRKGGGHQSKSLHFKNREGKRYVLRAIRKSATVYLQAMAFKDQYIEGQLDGTFTERLLQDFYTGSHPYAPFVIGRLSDAVNLYHTNPVLYFVPKQPALGRFNVNFGDALYMIEEHVSSGHGNLKRFGYANKIESTSDLIRKLRKDEKYVVDDLMFLRARLFDMAIGDWDRHVDQWRWAEFKEGDRVVYRPIPRDRDQVFSNMGDGALLNLATRIIPPLKLMEGFNAVIRSVKGFNSSPFSLDMMLLNETTQKQWEAEAVFLQNNLTDAVIENAFKAFPKEVQDKKTLNKLKHVLLSRIKNLKKTASIYFKLLNKKPLIRGTDKDDLFEIVRLPNGNTKITVSRIKNGEKGVVIHEKTYNKDATKEIWLYGLDDEDVFEVAGEGDNLIKLRLIGGQNNDVFNIVNGKKVKVYDYKSRKNTFITMNGTKTLTDSYKTNVYSYTKPKNTTNQLTPLVGANPDDGFKIGFVNAITNYGFERNPFSSQHTVSGAFYFATSGFDFDYNGEFANVLGTWNLGLTAKYTSPNYAINFFGFGNSTPNFNIEDSSNFNLDYNRVKISKLAFAPSLNWRGEQEAYFKVGLRYESIEVEETRNRFINTFYIANGQEVQKDFVSAEAIYSYENKDNKAFPTLGMQTCLQFGYSANIEEKKGFAYFIPELGFDFKLVPSGQLVFATHAKAHFIFGDNFEFYQAANLGANNGLRGFRNERFSGKNAFFQSSDLRLNLRRVKTGLLPLNIGVYTGFDYGRVWVDDALVVNTDFNSNSWNTSLGGGVFANAANILTLNLSAFHSDDNLRFAFKIGFGF